MFKSETAPKGKVATKGQKKIYEENLETLSLWSKCSFVVSGLSVLTLIVFWTSYGVAHILLQGFGCAVLVGCYKFLDMMATPIFSETGALIDAGSDLNCESGTAEYVKDILIVTLATTTLGLLSAYFWFLWLIVPVFAFYKAWVNILAPWFFQEAPPEMDEKKQKKMERKQQRRKFI